jgi:hypothetical protein
MADGVFQVLAQMNLLRGYLLSLPTGQALARAILAEQGVLTGDEILENASEAERNALKSAGLRVRKILYLTYYKHHPQPPCLITCFKPEKVESAPSTH